MAAARDGSPVELYALLPGLGEAEVVHGAVPAGAEVLELGCGAGRVSRRLVELGHRVVGVDESEAMLALASLVEGVETVHASIEALELGRRFRAVLLGSNLLNTPGRAARRALLDAATRHLADGGVVVCEHALDVGAAGRARRAGRRHHRRPAGRPAGRPTRFGGRRVRGPRPSLGARVHSRARAGRAARGRAARRRPRPRPLARRPPRLADGERIAVNR